MSDGHVHVIEALWCQGAAHAQDQPFHALGTAARILKLALRPGVAQPWDFAGETADG